VNSNKLFDSRKFYILTFVIKIKKGVLKMIKEKLELLNCNEFAQLLKIKTETVYSWLCKKQLPQSLYLKLGRKPMFIKSEVESWVLNGAAMTVTREV